MATGAHRTPDRTGLSPPTTGSRRTAAQRSTVLRNTSACGSEEKNPSTAWRSPNNAPGSSIRRRNTPYPQTVEPTPLALPIWVPANQAAARAMTTASGRHPASAARRLGARNPMNGAWLIPQAKKIVWLIRNCFRMETFAHTRFSFLGFQEYFES
jgi:hypothetical protein